MIEIKQLNFTYPNSKQKALDSIDLIIESNQVFGLLGSNGAGKTTLISLLTGLIQSNTDSIFIDQKPIHHYLTQNPANIGLIPQELSFYTNLSVYENCQFYASLYFKNTQTRNAAIEEALSLGQLQSYRHILAHKLSGGLKRRLNFAIGLIHRPKLVFMDEPTVGVDTQSRNYILDSIRKLSDNGVTIIYTSHYLQEVEQICTNYAILDGGKLAYHEDHLTPQYNNQLHIEFQHPINNSLLTYLKNHCSQLLLNNAQTKVTLILSHDQFTQHFLFYNLQQHIGANNTVIKFHFGKPSLESRYLEITNFALKEK